MDIKERMLVFEVDTTRCETTQHSLNGLEIKTIAHKPPANTLYLIEKRDGRPFRREIADNETVHVRNGERFVTEPPVGKAS